MSFLYNLKNETAEEGAETDMVLQAGDIVVPLRAEVFFSDMDDNYSLDGQTVLDDRLSDLITSRGTLRITALEDVVEIPLDGAREAARDLLTKCRPG